MTKRIEKKPDFTPATGKSIHVTIEAVFPIGEVRDMQDVLEQLRCYGSAVVTKRQFVAESFDDACKILDQREFRDE